MKHFKTLLYCVILLTFVSCSGTPNELSDKQKSIVAQEVVQMLNNYYADIAKEGLIAEFKYLDNSKDFFWVPPGYNSTLNYDSVRTILLSRNDIFSEFNFSWDTLQVFPISLHIATYAGVVNGSITDTTGVETVVRMIESGTLIKRKDGWKLLSGQSSIINDN